MRRDDNEQFGGHTTGSLAWGMDLGAGFRITANAGTAFKAPTFNELYFPFYGNPDLLPETSDTFELGVGQRRETWHWDVHAYQTRVDDLIVYDSSIFVANNLEEARIRGGELTGGFSLDGWNVTGAASYVDPRNRSNGDNFDKVLPRRARSSGRVEVDRAFGDFSVGATWLAEGRRFENVANSLELGGYSTFDLRAQWTHHRHLDRAGAREQRVRPRLRNGGVLPAAGSRVRRHGALFGEVIGAGDIRRR